MKFKKIQATELLRPYVKYIWVMDIEPMDLPYSQLYFPYGSFELIHYIDKGGLMQFAGQKDAFYQPKLFYSGQFTKPFTLSFDHPCRCFGVSFKPFMGNLLYNIPAFEFTDKMIELCDLDSKNRFSQQITPSDSDEVGFKKMEQYIWDTLQNNQIDAVSQHIAESILLSPNRDITNKALSHIGLSKRRIEQRFIQSTGLTMGAFTRKIRFQKAVTLLQNSTESLTQIGLQVGYYDQSHFISEFKAYSFLPPHSFIKQQTQLGGFLSSLVKS